MNASVTLDILLSESCGNTLYFDKRSCPTNLILEAILRGLQVIEVNSAHGLDYGYRFQGSHGIGNGIGDGDPWCGGGFLYGERGGIGEGKGVLYAIESGSGSYEERFYFSLFSTFKKIGSEIIASENIETISKLPGVYYVG